MLLDILFEILSILPFQFKFSSKVKPRQFKCKAFSIVVLSINRCRGFTVLCYVKYHIFAFIYI